MMVTGSVQKKPDRTYSGIIPGRLFKGLEALLLFFFVLLFLPLKAHAGFWEQTGGPEGGNIQSIVMAPNYDIDQTVFSLVDGNIYKSTDGGETWLQVFDHFVQNIVISPDYSNDQTLFAISDPPFENTAVYTSIDGGIAWSKISNLSAFINFSEIAISPLFAVDQTLFAQGTGGMHRSTDGGVTWVRNVSTPQPIGPVGDFSFSPSYAQDQTIFSIGSNKALIKSIDGGVSWSVIRTLMLPINDPKVFSLRLVKLSQNYMVDQTIFLSVSDGRFNPTRDVVYTSTDGGVSWSPASSGLGGGAVHYLAISPSYTSDRTLFLANFFDVPYKSTDGGLTWTPINTGLPNIPTKFISVSPAFQTDRTVFAGTTGAGIVKSVDGGTNWVQKNSGIKHALVFSSIAISPFYKTDRTIFAGAYPEVAKSTNGGDAWPSINTGLPSGAVTEQLLVSPAYQTDQTAFAIIQEADFGFTSSTPITAYKTVDSGQSWVLSNSGLPTTPSPTGGGFGCLAFSPSYKNDQTVFFFGWNGVFRAVDSGASWIKVNNIGFGGTSCHSKIGMSPSYATDQTIFASDRGGVWKSADAGISFAPINNGLPASLSNTSLVVSPSYGTDQILFVLRGLKLFKSTDEGLSWTLSATFPSLIPTDSNINVIAISPAYSRDRTLFGADLKPHSGGRTRYIWKSVDDGVTWERILTPLHNIPSAWSPPAIRLSSMEFSPGYPCDGTLFFGTGEDGVWKYIDTEAISACRPPGITSLSTTSGASGDAVTITGTNFVANQGTSTVTIGGAAATVTSWSDTQIIVSVPAGATTGPLVVTVNGVPVTAPQDFTVLQPRFTLSIAPNVQTVASGGSAAFTLSLTSIDGFNQPVGFDNPLGLPPGATANYSPATVVPLGDATLTIQTVPTTPPGSYPLTINANGGGAGDVKGVTLEVTAPVPSPTDTDGDGVLNHLDNCPEDLNPDQQDIDEDGRGDICDSDIDGDGLTNTEEATAGTESNKWDTDGDHLSDGLEVKGVPHENSEFLLDLKGMGADPLHKDIFVEVDYMMLPANCPPGEKCSTPHSHKPYDEAIQKVVDAFAKAPLYDADGKLINNPDGTPGIRLHVDNGRNALLNYPGDVSRKWGDLSQSGIIAEKEILGIQQNETVSYVKNQCVDTTGITWWERIRKDFNEKKQLDKSRQKVFHYVIFSHDTGVYEFDPKSNKCVLKLSGGLSHVPASDFIVSLGSHANDKSEGSIDQQAGTFMHELGHNLGLKHGGQDEVNYKPNYLSVMNYSFQVSGVYTPKRLHDYSRFGQNELPDLIEFRLDESMGLAPKIGKLDEYRTVYYGQKCTTGIQLPGGATPIQGSALSPKIKGWIDWDCDGIVDPPLPLPLSIPTTVSSTSVDINKDNGTTILHSYNDWADLKFEGDLSRPIGRSAGSGLPVLQPSSPPPVELTPEEDALIPKLFAVLVSNPGNQILPQGKSTTFLFKIINKGVKPDSYTLTATSSRGWSNMGGMPPSVSLLPGEEFIFEVQTTVPSNAANGDTDDLTIRADSTGSSGLLDLSTVTITAFDGNPPTITASVSPPPDASGAHNTDVTVTFICADAESGIASCTPPATVTTNGTGQVITGTAVDLAGNTATTSVTLNIDKTSPTMKGDLNADGCIDRGDYRILITDIRNRPPNDPAHDLNGDGRVNVADARTLIRLFTNPRGAPCP